MNCTAAAFTKRNVLFCKDAETLYIENRLHMSNAHILIPLSYCHSEVDILKVQNPYRISFLYSHIAHLK